MPKLSLFVIPILAMTLAGCGGGGGDTGDDGRPTDLEEAIRIVDEFVCTDERERAIDYATFDDYETAAPALWDDTPFVVDISHSYPNADELLNAVADEAEWINAVLGYEVFVAGDVLPLVDITENQLRYISSAEQLIPPDGHIHIRCCYPSGTRSAGTAYPWWRVLMLENDPFQSRHIIVHELYHILGFSHIDNPEGVMMSETLMGGPGHDASGASIPTDATPLDLAKLACIYD